MKCYRGTKSVQHALALGGPVPVLTFKISATYSSLIPALLFQITGGAFPKRTRCPSYAVTAGGAAGSASAPTTGTTLPCSGMRARAATREECGFAEVTFSSELGFKTIFMEYETSAFHCSICAGGGGNTPPETHQPNSSQDAVMRLAQERAMQGWIFATVIELSCF